MVVRIKEKNCQDFASRSPEGLNGVVAFTVIG